MLLLISGDIHPNPYKTPAPSAPVESPGKTDRYNVPTVLSGYTSPVPVSPPRTFAKSPRDTLGLAQCAHPPLKSPPSFHILTPYLHPQTPSNPHLHLQILTNPYLQK